MAGQLTALAQTASGCSAALLSPAMASSFLDTLHLCRRWLLPLLPALGQGGGGGVEEVAKGTVALLVWPLASLSPTPAAPPFAPFLAFLCAAVDALQWMPAVLSPQAKSPPRSDQPLFELHSLHLQLTRQRGLEAGFSEAIARCIPSAQGGALTDDLLFVMPAAIAQPHGQGAGGGAAVVGAGARQPLDPFQVLEGCGAGPVVDGVWESSGAVRRQMPAS